MKELDLLLERYLDRRWPTAPEAHRAAFRRLLELPDPELAALCLGRGVTPVTEFAQLLAEITDPAGRELSADGAVYRGDFGRNDRPEREP